MSGHISGRAPALEAWRTVTAVTFGKRALPVDAAIGDASGRIAAIRDMPAVAALLAATARVHGLVPVARGAGIRNPGGRVPVPFGATA